MPATKRKNKKKPSRFIKIRRAAACLLLAAVLVGCSVLLGKIFRKEPEPIETGELKYIPLLGSWARIQSGVSVNEYDAECFAFEDGRMSYNDDSRETWFGIDVSSHQGKIDWEKVKGDGVQFAFLRVGSRGNTEGNLYTDNRFEENYREATKQGIAVGAYFFSQAINAKEAKEEANLVLEILDKRKLDFPVVFDWEYVSEEARTANIDPKVVSECCKAFCETIKKAGYTPMVYFNCYTAYLCYDLIEVDCYDFWAAEFTTKKPTFYYDYTILQYSCSGKIAGINKDVDLNLAFVNYAK